MALTMSLGVIHEYRAQEPIECWQFRNFENDTRPYRSCDFQWEMKPPVFYLIELLIEANGFPSSPTLRADIKYKKELWHMFI